MSVIVMVGAAAIVVATAMSWVAGAARRLEPGESPDDLRFVFVLADPSRRTIDRLLAQRTDQRFAVMVVDDGRNPGTAAMLTRYAGDARVWVVQSAADDEPLEVAYSVLRAKVRAAGADADAVVVTVLQGADRMERDALDAIAPYFADRKLGSVNVGVRVENAPGAVAARLQDIDLASGIGDGGRFVRLSALTTVAEGGDPGGELGTDLGVHLTLAGWDDDVCPQVTVSRQGQTSLRELVLHRSHWYQGRLDGLRLVPLVRKSELPARAKADLVARLVHPSLMLALQTLSIVWSAATCVLVTADPASAFSAVGAARLAVLYLLVFAPVPFVTLSYWRAEPTMTITRAAAYAHLYLIVGFRSWAASITEHHRRHQGRTGAVATR